MDDRIAALRTFLNKNNLDAALISSPSNITYLTGFSNFSLNEREGFVLVAQKNAYIFTDARYSDAILEQVPNFALIELIHDNPFAKNLAMIAKADMIRSIGFEEHDLTVSEFEKIKKACKSLHPLSLQKLRIKKTPEEIENIKKACQVGDGAFAHILSLVKVGVTEKELACELEYYIKKQGADLSFPSIVAFGRNSAVPHHQTGNTRLEKNQWVILDFGATFSNYHSDMTRTIFFGKPSDEQKKIYEIVLNAQKSAVDFLTSYLILHTSKRKKLQASDVDQVARKYILSHGYPSIPHSVGHGIGLEVHEAPSLSPKSKDNLENGMVFSIEPGIYLSGRGGVRIEDLFAIQDNTLTRLTNATKNFTLDFS